MFPKVDLRKNNMYKLLHIHSNIVFIDHSRRYICEKIHNEIAFIGENSADTITKLNQYGISFKIYKNSIEGINQIIKDANQFDGIIFHALGDVQVRILYGVRPRVKTFLKFFGYELYNLKMNKFLSDKTLKMCDLKQEHFSVISSAKRKLKILLNLDYFVKLDNQKKVYKKFDAILIVNKEEYEELQTLFYMPKLIERQFIDQIEDIEKCRIIARKSNEIIIGNHGAEINNHIDILDIIKDTYSKEDVKFKLFFNYGNTSNYSKRIKNIALEIKNVTLIENFLSMKEFETVYESAAALVINSYRQNALGNIFMAIEVGCKIYLNRKCSTYKWLISNGFNISEVDDLKKDLELGNIKLSVDEQQKNIDCFISVVKKYSISDFIDNIITVLEEK